MNIISNLCERILVIDPDARCSTVGNDYDLLVWNADNINPAPPSAAACLTVDLTADRRQKAIDLAKDKMNADPVFATIAQGVPVLKATADGTTVATGKQALLDDLEARIP